MIQFRDVAWRAMSGYDFKAVFDIANKVHPGFFEAEAVLAEKFTLYRNGCYLLEVSEKPAGYVLSHPWKRGSLPALDTLLGQLPADADSYYIHDLALLPLTRGVGAAGQIVAALTKHAQAMGFATMSLVAVNGSVAFWEKQGFVAEERPELADKLKAYEDAARYMVKQLV
ncbi:GNAT family N-acetyltransferase [uncultured Devosia sp.]|uniref:GNAT family N-acetyltransferase n=1 Tax=uncultured Devosia sp. TaxID=211434 RepID=UPI0026188061|nr:GNAT family N-acetyltransferase [uncultured Devosia sp.]